MKARFVSALAIAGLALAGCSPTSVQPPTPTETAAQSPAPTPTGAENPADPGTWVVGFGTVGPLSVGDTLADATAELSMMAGGQQDACPYLAIFTFDGLPTFYLPLGDDGIVDQLALITYSPDAGLTAPLTAEGIGIGSTADEILAAYPDAQVSQGKYELVYSITDGSGYFINFGVNAGGDVDNLVTRDSTAIDGEYCG